MIKKLILEAEKIISEYCDEQTDYECLNDKCKYGINLDEDKGYLCTKVFRLSLDYKEKNR